MITFNEVFYSYQDKEEKSGLDDINLSIPKGQFVLITGKSGCGKTTLSKCINGLIPYFNEGKLEGDIFIEGRKTKDLSIEDIGEKVGSVFQNPRSQFFTTNTFDEIAFGCQNMSLPREEILSRIEESLKCFKIENLRDKSLFNLSSGEKQKVAIASCYSMKPQIFLLDEPSANLDPKAVGELSAILGRLKCEGYTIVIMEHRLYYLKDLIDRVIYMEEGKIIGDFTRQEALELSSQALEKMGLRVFDLEKVRKYPSWELMQVNKPFSREFTYGKERQSVKGDFIELSVENISFDYCRKNKRKHSRFFRTENEQKFDSTDREQLLNDISFKAESGEIIGIVGKNGAGKTTLAKILTGLLNNSKGSIKLNGRVLEQKERLKMTYFVLQDSDYQLFAESVEKELRLGNEGIEHLEEKAEEVLESLGLGNCLEKHPASLSRGQKQRLTIAAGLLSEAPILILDEPTSGLDGESMRQVMKMMEDISKTGKIVLIISHDYEFLTGCCTHILEVREGCAREKFELADGNLKRLKKILFEEEVVK